MLLVQELVDKCFCYLVTCSLLCSLVCPQHLKTWRNVKCPTFIDSLSSATSFLFIDHVQHFRNNSSDSNETWAKTKECIWLFHFQLSGDQICSGNVAVQLCVPAFIEFAAAFCMHRQKLITQSAAGLILGLPNIHTHCKWRRAHKCSSAVGFLWD